MDKYELVLEKMSKRFGGKNKFSMTFTPDMLADGDTWLLQVAYYGKTEKLTFVKNEWGIIRIKFDDGFDFESTLLENVPESFLDTLINVL